MSDTKDQRDDTAFERHTADGFRCTDPRCMFPAQPYTWCTRKAR